MRMNLLIRSTFIVLLAASAACRKADSTPDPATGRREPASLVLTADFSALVSDVTTRTNDADLLTLDHVSLFLIDSLENRLVAYRNINPPGTAMTDDTDDDNKFIDEKTVQVTFNYDAPKHGLAEKLTRGSYVLLAVANYSESDDFGKSGIAAKIKEVIDIYNRMSETGIGNFQQEYADFYNLMLQIPDKPDGTVPYVRPSNVSIPLSCTHILHLISGTNRQQVELKHTCARVQIKVRNLSEQTLTVRDLAFSDNFTQSACYLFSRANTDENYIIVENEHRGKGAPVVEDSNAITPFVKGTTVDGSSAAQAPTTKTIFDGLIYESRDTEGNYTYTIEVAYENAQSTHYTLKNGGYPISSLSEIASTGPYFIIRHRAGGLLYVKDDKVYASTDGRTPQEALDRCKENGAYYDYVWVLESASNGRYYLRNAQTEDYIGRITDGTNGTRLVMVGTESQTTAADIFTVETTGTWWEESHFAFRSNYFSGTAYINVWGGNSDTVAAWSSADAGSQFDLYPLEKTSEQGLSSRQEVVLRTIDKTTSEVSDVHEIQRNDYIRVLIEVSYNPDKGDFEFKVNPWNQGGGDITFN